MDLNNLTPWQKKRRSFWLALQIIGITPNIITSSKLIFFLLAFICHNERISPNDINLMIAGWLTDIADGDSARLTEMVSTNGKLWDRFSDKLGLLMTVIVVFFVFRDWKNSENESILFTIAATATIMSITEIISTGTIIYQKLTNPEAKGGSAINFGKCKLLMHAIFTCAFFAPIHLLWLQPYVLFISGMVGSLLGLLSLGYHIKMVISSKAPICAN